MITLIITCFKQSSSVVREKKFTVVNHLTNNFLVSVLEYAENVDCCAKRGLSAPCELIILMYSG